MNILVTICARAGSKGVKSKNIRDFLGAPICYYTLSAYALFLRRYGEEYGDFTLAVNTDAPALFAQLDRTGLDYLRVPRKASLAGDSASKIDVIRDTLREAQRRTKRTYDAVIDMDLTSPLRRAVDIRNVLDALLANPEAEIALSVTEARRNPYFNQLAVRPSGFLGTAIESDFVARQQAPQVFDANASLYAYRPDVLLNAHTILIKAKLVPSVMPDTAVLDIDSERDYELLGVVAQYFFDSDPAYGEVRDAIPQLFKDVHAN
ncbi:MAG: acylneuraminate cytidylyltransferase family protein [Oscillospiraceae bacterium]|nr:acylneuraminate cytidylyltransferase family protein [Oscillospiraceae bacterium]